LGSLMRGMEKAKGGGDRKSEEYHWGFSDPGDMGEPLLAPQGIDKNLAKRARVLRAATRAPRNPLLPALHHSISSTLG
jgi:hypothetical protein